MMKLSGNILDLSANDASNWISRLQHSGTTDLTDGEDYVNDLFKNVVVHCIDIY